MASHLLSPWGMKPQDLRQRLERFADGVVALCRSIAHDPLQLRLLLQLQDAATSAAANYRAACRAQTRPMFVSKLSVALEEADEATYWLERLACNRVGHPEAVETLRQEAHELSAILNASRRTAAGSGRKRRA